jgi:hypothetical protein
MNKLRIGAIAVLMLTGSLAAQKREVLPLINVTQIEVTRTTLDKSKPAAVAQEQEHKTYFISDTGAFRKELLLIETKQKSVEIQHWRENRRIILDASRKQAFVGSTQIPFSAPIATPNQWIPTGVRPEGLNSDSTPLTPIGTKTVGGLVLEGFQHVVNYSGAQNFTHVIELWMYRFKDPLIPPILMEMRASGEWGFDEETIQSVTTKQASPAIFEVPRDFTTIALTR